MRSGSISTCRACCAICALVKQTVFSTSQAQATSLVFQIGFDEKGRVTGADAISGHPLGISHLMVGVSKWRFRPATVNGATKKACGKLSIQFAMKENVPSAEVVR
jgi:hypothetical protein